MRFALGIAAGVAFACLVAQPALAGTGTASAGSLTVTITVDDVTFTGPECIKAPVRVTYSGPGSVDLAASQEGSSNTLTAYSYSSEPGTVVDGIQVCPALDGAGTYIIRGTVTGEDVSAPLPAGVSFNARTAPATLGGLQARQTRDTLTIKGRATAQSNRGQIGAQGEVTLQGKLPKSAGGKGKWITIGTAYPDEFGRFTYQGSTRQKLRGAFIRAILAEGDWSGSATTTTRVR